MTKELTKHFGRKYVVCVLALGFLGVFLVDKIWDWEIFHARSTDPAALDSTEFDVNYIGHVWIPSVLYLVILYVTALVVWVKLGRRHGE